jgi:hypothetical protein
VSEEAIQTVAGATVPRVRLERLVPLIAGIAVVAVGVTIIDGQPVGAARDDSMYVLLAKSLATGHGYRWLHIPGMPLATHFPPGYPAVLSLLWLLFPVFPANVILFKLANVVFSAVAAVCVARFVRSRCGMTELGAQAFALVAMLAAPMLALTTQVLSEPLFLALVVVTVLLAERVLDGPPGRWRSLIAVGAFAGVATLVRTHGVALLVAIPVVLCLRGRFRDALIFAGVAIATVLPWQVFVAAHSGVFPVPMRGNYESYGALLVDALRANGVSLFGAAALRTMQGLAFLFGYTVSPFMGTAGRAVAATLFAALCAIGASALRRQAPATTLFLALYFLIVLFWPYTPARFVWCLAPFLLLLPVAGVRELIAWSPRSQWQSFARVLSLATVAFLACGYAVFTVSAYRVHSWSTAAYAGYLRPLLVHVALHTPPNALLASEAEGTVYLYTGRRTVPVGSFMATDYLTPRTPAENANALATVIERYHPKAVVVKTSFLRAAARELTLRQPPLLAVADTIAGGGLVLVPTPR